MTEDHERTADEQSREEQPGQGGSSGTQDRTPQEGQSHQTASTGQESVGDILGKERTQHYIKYNIGLFSMIGLGFGLSLLLFDAFISGNGGNEFNGGGGGGEILLLGFLFAFLLGPVLASISGVVTGLRLDETANGVGITAGVGAFIGFMALVFSIVILGSLVGGPADEGTGELTNELLAIIGFGIGVGVTGFGTAYLTKKFA